MGKGKYIFNYFNYLIRYVVLLVFAIEHFIIITIFAFKKVANAAFPSWVELWKKREQYHKTLRKIEK